MSKYKTLITTQYLENYGAHSENGKFEDGNAYWKFKGGEQYVISTNSHIRRQMQSHSCLLICRRITTHVMVSSWSPAGRCFRKDGLRRIHSIRIISNSLRRPTSTSKSTWRCRRWQNRRAKLQKLDADTRSDQHRARLQSVQNSAQENDSASFQDNLTTRNQLIIKIWKRQFKF